MKKSKIKIIVFKSVFYRFLRPSSTQGNLKRWATRLLRDFSVKTAKTWNCVVGKRLRVEEIPTWTVKLWWTKIEAKFSRFSKEAYEVLTDQKRGMLIGMVGAVGLGRVRRAAGWFLAGAGDFSDIFGIALLIFLWRIGR